MKAKAMAWGLALVGLVGAMPALGTAPSPAEDAARTVIGLLFDVTHVDRMLRESAQDDAGKKDPMLREFVARVMQTADAGALRDSVATPIAGLLTPDDVAALQGFSDQPAVQTLRQLGATYQTQAELIAAVNALPRAQQQDIERVLGAPAVQHVLAALRSPEVKLAAQHWSEHVVCDYVRAHPDQFSIDRLVADGKCPAN
jgi:hypothetical protein